MTDEFTPDIPDGRSSLSTSNEEEEDTSELMAPLLLDLKVSRLVSLACKLNRYNSAAPVKKYHKELYAFELQRLTLSAHHPGGEPLELSSYTLPGQCFALLGAL